MKTISARITVGAPRSIARFNEYKQGNPLPICANCLERAPQSMTFRPLGLNVPFVVESTCYCCEDETAVSFCSAKPSLADHTGMTPADKRGLLRHCIVSTD